MTAQATFKQSDVKRAVAGVLAVDKRPASYGTDAMQVSVTRFPHADWPNVHQDEWCGEYKTKAKP